MAYEQADQRIAAVAMAANVRGRIRTIYADISDLAAVLALYQSGADPVFNAAFNVLFGPQERLGGESRGSDSHVGGSDSHVGGALCWIRR